jgi:hypothetical protein
MLRSKIRRLGFLSRRAMTNSKFHDVCRSIRELEEVYTEEDANFDMDGGFVEQNNQLSGSNTRTIGLQTNNLQLIPFDQEEEVKMEKNITYFTSYSGKNVSLVGMDTILMQLKSGDVILGMMNQTDNFLVPRVLLKVLW